jgi:hypothetical protein
MFRSFPQARKLALLGALAALAPIAYADGISATATFTDTQVSPGEYQYNLTLNNTGTTTIGTFWFSWVPGAGFMVGATPTDITSPAGWTDTVTNAGKAIQWKTTTSLLAPGDWLSGFSFESTLTPAELEAAYAGPGTGTGDPVDTAFVYIAAPLADPGFQLTAQATPEPGTFWLTLTGLCLVAAAVFKSRLNSASTSASLPSPITL